MASDFACHILGSKGIGAKKGLSSNINKARIRWYSKNQFGHISESSELVLEIKLRSNVLGE